MPPLSKNLIKSSNHFFSAAKSIRLLSVVFMALVFSLASCKSKNTGGQGVTINPPAMVKSKDLTEERVIEIAKNLLSQSRKTVSIQMHYWNTVITKVACTQYDKDAGVNCSEPAAGAPYGYKTVPQQVRECCKQVDYPLYNSIGNWSAEYSDREDKWTVTYQFNADDLKYHFVWIVDDNSSQITEQGLNQQ